MFQLYVVRGRMRPGNTHTGLVRDLSVSRQYRLSDTGRDLQHLDQISHANTDNDTPVQNVTGDCKKVIMRRTKVDKP